MEIGVTKANTGIEGIEWHILGQIYVPKQHCESSLSWHATFPPGTFVPPHIHPHQEEFVYMLSGRLDVLLDGQPGQAEPGDLVRLPRGVPHGLFNKSDAAVKCFFWVSPARRLYDLFWALHNLGPTPAIPDVVALAAQHEVDFLPPARRAVRVLIVGAGIGGLTTALMLHRRGIAAEIFEQAPTVREVGVGINTLPHAIGELAELGLLPALERTGIRTGTLIYFNRQGQEVWREARGLDAGHKVPQFSIHRGRLQKLLHDAVLERLGADAVRTGLSLSGFMQDEGGVTAHFTDTRRGDAGLTARGDVLVCADGIHSVARHRFYPDEGSSRWNGMMMWRGATESDPWRDGRTMAIGGGMGAKFVLYPIAEAEGGRQLMNWVVNVVTASALAPPPKESWSRPAPRATVLPFARRFAIPGFDIMRLVEATPQAFEYPMCDRDPLPRWTFDRVTLLGDAAHPMYPVGSNGASQAILDARALADALATAEHPRQALWRYERERLPKTAEIVRLNRGGGPERVIDEVEKRAPAGFADIETVLPQAERAAIVKGYASTLPVASP